MKNAAVTIIAGPCSINEENQGQLFDIAQLTISSDTIENKRVIWGLRVVGLKSRTAMNNDGAGMGVDFPAYQRNLDRFLQGGTADQFEIPPSVGVIKKIIHETGVVVATEIVDPLIQLPPYEKEIPKEKLFIWNPAVNQLGHSALAMGKYAARNDWYLGFKNGKWLGDVPKSGMSTMEKSWIGLTTYATGNNRDTNTDKLVMIQRGVDVPGKGDYRNLPVHDAAQRVKKNLGLKLFFDPSHSHGPSLKHLIVKETIAALKLTTVPGEYLYDGILLEVGDSTTDTDQHVTISELRELCEEVATFRTIRSPD